MSELLCQYCQKEYSSIPVLIKHQKTTKRCLEIQKKMNIDSIKVEYNCLYCNKGFTSKQTLKNHATICIGKREHKIEDLLKEIEELKLMNKNLEKENMKLQLNIAELNGELKSSNKASECVYEIAKQPKNTNTITNNGNNTNNTNNTTKTLNITSPLDFSNIELIKEIINEKYNIEYFLDGQKGIAQFAVDNLLKDENGNYKYNCSDPSRNVFKYKNLQGEIIKDIEAKKLTNYLVDGGIKGKANDVSLRWYENDGIIDHDRFIITSEKYGAILTILENNNEFKKELVSLTTV